MCRQRTLLWVHKNRRAATLRQSDCTATSAMTTPFHFRVVHIAKAFQSCAAPALSVVLCVAFASMAWAQQFSGETVMLDAWFNSQQRKNAAGQKEYFHYKWNDSTDSGYSLFGQIFASHGAALQTLYQASHNGATEKRPALYHRLARQSGEESRILITCSRRMLTRWLRG